MAPGDTARLVHNGSLSPLGVIAYAEGSVYDQTGLPELRE